MSATCHPERPIQARGLCKACYARLWRNKSDAELLAVVAKWHQVKLEDKRQVWQRSRANGARPGWTTLEIAKLRRLYSSAPKAVVLEEMKPRTWLAIREMALKLDIERPVALGGQRRRWKRILRDHVPVFGLPTDVEFETSYKRSWR
jgi:hypothetical protein